MLVAIQFPRIRKRKSYIAMVAPCSTISCAYSVRVTLAIMLVCILSLANSLETAHSAEMFVLAPTEPTFLGGTSSTIFIEGEINEETPKQLERVIESKKVDPYSFVVFNSPGGNLYAGMELGRVIRKYGLRTDIGRWNSPRKSVDDISSGGCFSACTLAFLGGKFRFYNPKNGDHFGVHRFFFKQNDLDLGVDVAQIASAAIIGYLKEMDVDPEFFELTTRAGANGIYEPTIDELTALNAVNYGFGKTSWSVESANDLLYLKGQRDTEFGINKFMVVCRDRKLYLHVVFDPQGRQDLVKRLPLHSLMINGTPTNIEPTKVSIVNGWYNGVYFLSKSTWKRLLAAKTVGVILRGGIDAPVFWGFDSMPMEGGQQKLRGLIRNCQ